VVHFAEIYNVCAGKAMIEAAKRIINYDKVCRSYNDLNFGVAFWNRVYNTELFVRLNFQKVNRPFYIASRHRTAILVCKYTDTH